MRAGAGVRSLVILAKEPRPGRVKTRLARDIGTIAAAGWYRNQLARLARRLSPDPRWRTVIAVSPDTSLASRAWPRGLDLIPQGDGDLGIRMIRALAAQPPGPAVLIGADIPGVRREHIARAFSLLGQFETVLGPSDDGGYWLIGLRRSTAALSGRVLSGIRWSSPHALSDTTARLAPHSVGFADRLSDVDTGEDLARLSRVHSA